MSDTIQIELLPLGKTLKVPRGTLLQDVLFAHGVEFPCGGRGRCRGCRIKVLHGSLPPTAAEAAKFAPAELAQGWRLSCQSRAEGDLKIELAQWEAAILTDNSSFAFVPQEGYGVAVDLGTTTIVAQLLDLKAGAVRAVRSAFNSQARHGADIMSRIEFALGGSQAALTRLIREQIGEMICDLLEAARLEAEALKKVTIVGNTVMHHLFCGIDVAPLAASPFEPERKGLELFAARELGWKGFGNPAIRFLPCLGSFVGSDILAGVLATEMHQSQSLRMLIDLGTNGEIVLGDRERLLCASTAAGPAFEGARISMGMRAASGAISEVALKDGAFRCHVLGATKPVGLCGSGLVDAIACSLDLGLVKPSGRLCHGTSLPLSPPVNLTQQDIRELQYAKGAIAAGIRILLRRWGATSEDVTQVYLAGAFGNYIHRASARRIGLLQFPLDTIRPAGNTALLGAKLALFNQNDDAFHYPKILSKTEHLSLNEDLEFQEIYAEEMAFPSEG